jgi:hypothetical protein
VDRLFDHVCALAPLVLAVWLAACNTTPALVMDPAPVVDGNTPASTQARATALALVNGINFGNKFEGPNEGDWGLRADDEFINLVGTSGFTQAVRLPVRWSNHASADAAAIEIPQRRQLGVDRSPPRAFQIHASGRSVGHASDAGGRGLLRRGCCCQHASAA